MTKPHANKKTFNKRKKERKKPRLVVFPWFPSVRLHEPAKKNVCPAHPERSQPAHYILLPPLTSISPNGHKASIVAHQTLLDRCCASRPVISFGPYLVEESPTKQIKTFTRRRDTKALFSRAADTCSLRKPICFNCPHGEARRAP